MLRAAEPIGAARRGLVLDEFGDDAARALALALSPSRGHATGTRKPNVTVARGSLREASTRSMQIQLLFAILVAVLPARRELAVQLKRLAADLTDAERLQAPDAGYAAQEPDGLLPHLHPRRP